MVNSKVTLDSLTILYSLQKAPYNELNIAQEVCLQLNTINLKQK